MIKYLLVAALLSGCTSKPERIASETDLRPLEQPTCVAEIEAPRDYTRIPLEQNSFGHWLRTLKLKSNNKVYLFDGRLKRNQVAHFAVLDIRLPKQDLQQCADAIMRLRAEYLKFSGREDLIAFHAGDGTLIDYVSYKQGYRFLLQNGRLQRRLTSAPSTSDATFEKYLELVFTFCGTRTLEKELQKISPREVLPGDILIQGGSPGHAVIIIDMVQNNRGDKRFLLAQSYMPAQDMHILRNPLIASGNTPWYQLPGGEKLYTPEWVFEKDDFRRFPNLP